MQQPLRLPEIVSHTEREGARQRPMAGWWGGVSTGEATLGTKNTLDLTCKHVFDRETPLAVTPLTLKVPYVGCSLMTEKCSFSFK